MNAQQEQTTEHDYLFHPQTTSFTISHKRYPNDVSYVKGNIHPNVLPILLAYIQFQMNEVEEHVTLFPRDLKKILINLYGFCESVPEQGTTIELTENMERYARSESATLLLPFFRKGLYKELKSVADEIIYDFNGSTPLV